MGNIELLCMQCRGIGPHLMARGKYHGFLELRRENGECSRVMAEMIVQAHVCSAKSELLSSYVGYLRNLLEAWQRNTGTACGESGDPGSLSSCHSDNAIPINFQEESGIVTF